MKRFLSGVLACVILMSQVVISNAYNTAMGPDRHQGLTIMTDNEAYMNADYLYEENYWYGNSIDVIYDIEDYYDMVNQDINGQFNLNKTLSNSEINKLFEFIEQDFYLTYWEPGYSYKTGATNSGINFSELNSSYYNFTFDAGHSYGIYYPTGTFTLTQSGIDRLENMYHGFDYAKFIEERNGLRSGKHDIFSGDSIITVSNTGVHSIEFDTGGAGGSHIYYYPTGYAIDDILYVNLNKYFEVFNGGVDVYNERYDRYMILQMTGDSQYPFKLLEKGIGSNDKSEVTAWVEDFKTSNVELLEEEYNVFTTVKEYIDYLILKLQELNGSALNQKALEAVEEYLYKLFEKCDDVEISVSGNQLSIESTDFEEILSMSQSYYKDIIDIFNTYDITLSIEAHEKLELLNQGLLNVVENGEKANIGNLQNYEILDLPNVSFDASVYQNFKTNDEYIDYLIQILNDIDEVNKRGVGVVEDYISYVYANLNPAEIDVVKNTINLSYSEISREIENQKDFEKSLNSTLALKNIELTKNMDNTLVLDATKADEDKTNTILLSADLFGNLDGITSVTVLLSNKGHAVSFDTADMKLGKTVQIEIKFDGETVHIKSLDENGKSQDEIEYKIYVSVPSQSMTATVFASIGDTLENWGGQFNEVSKTIEFATTFAGDYEVNENFVEIFDISELPEETQEKIAFMVSKGFFSVDENGNFNPYETVERYHFVSALVRMFFSQDSEATSSFDDLKPEDYYYAIVSAGVKAGIINGYQDNTFRGNVLITRDELVGFVARTLADRKGYKYSDFYENVLSIYSDADTIEEWAKQDIALALEYGLIDYGQYFEPETEVTRLEALELLYTLFMNLYEVQTVGGFGISVSDIDLVLVGGIAGAVLFALILLLVIISASRKKKAKVLVSQTVPMTDYQMGANFQQPVQPTVQQPVQQTVQSPVQQPVQPPVQQQVQQTKDGVCKNCNSNLKENAKFCNKCGTKV